MKDLWRLILLHQECGLICWTYLQRGFRQKRETLTLATLGKSVILFCLSLWPSLEISFSDYQIDSISRSSPYFIFVEEFIQRVSKGETSFKYCFMHFCVNSNPFKKLNIFYDLGDEVMTWIWTVKILDHFICMRFRLQGKRLIGLETGTAVSTLKAILEMPALSQ